MTLSAGSTLKPSRTASSRYIVSLKDRLKSDQDIAFLKQDGFRHLETFEFPEEAFPGFGGDLVLVEAVEAVHAEEFLRELQEDPRVDYVEPDLELEFVPSEQKNDGPAATRKPDDLKSSLWGLNSSRDNDIDAPEAWAKTTGSRNGPIIAVLDTGVDVSHPDLAANIWTNPREIPGNGRDDDGNGVVDDVHGYDAYYKDGEPEDKNGHGTHCAGTIGAVGDNGKGIVGVNWQARIMPIKIFNNAEKPRTSVSAMLRGISYAGRHGARVTSNSWGGPSRSRSVERAFRNSRAFHFMAAGNDSQNNDEEPHYPSNYSVSNSLAVGSINRSGRLSSFSNYGVETVDLAAPGSSIYSTTPEGRYGYKSGTSMATPHVAGVAGLALTLDPSLSNKDLKEALLTSVEPKARLEGKVASGGWVNADRTLDEVAKLAETRREQSPEG